MPNKVISLYILFEPITTHIDGPVHPYKKDKYPWKIEVEFEDGSSIITDHRRKNAYGVTEAII